MIVKSQSRIPKPKWLKRRLPSGPDFEEVKNLLKQGHLHTVCQEARCPNIWECFSRHTATFLILGDRCTRNCRFCAVDSGPVEPPDPREPERVAGAVEKLALQYVVITSVTRDDLTDGGASHFADTIVAVRTAVSDVRVEVLIPDFKGSRPALEKVLAAAPDVLNHNIETVPRLYPEVRPEADYLRSLSLLAHVRDQQPALPTKSGLMLGLGETDGEIRQSLLDLLDNGCRMLTLGQYLQPTREHLPVQRFVPPEVFEDWRKIALEMGFAEVASGPFVRSSYHAKALYASLAG